MSKVDDAVKLMEEIANDPTSGYDQTYRWGEKGDYDCSSLIITVFEKAGFPVKSKYGATYTGNMKSAFIKAGFKDVIKSVDITTGAGLKKGDILLNEIHHTALYKGNGKIIQASANEFGTAVGGKSGDQLGKEINISPYRNYRNGGWDTVLRLIEKPTSTDIQKETKYMPRIIKIKVGNKIPTVNAINVDGNEYIKIRDLDSLGIIKVDYDNKLKMPIIEKVK